MKNEKNKLKIEFSLFTIIFVIVSLILLANTTKAVQCGWSQNAFCGLSVDAPVLSPASPTPVYYNTPIDCSASTWLSAGGGIILHMEWYRNGGLVQTDSFAGGASFSHTFTYTQPITAGDEIICESWSASNCAGWLEAPWAPRGAVCQKPVVVQPYPTRVLGIGAPPNWAYYEETAKFQCSYQRLESPYDTRWCKNTTGSWKCFKTGMSYSNIALCNAACPPDGDYVYTIIGAGATCTATIDGGTPNNAAWDGVTYSYSDNSLSIGTHTFKCDCSYPPNYGSASGTTTYEIKPRKTGIIAKTKPTNPVAGTPVKFTCSYQDIVNAPAFPFVPGTFLSGATCHVYVGPSAAGPFTEYGTTEDVIGKYYWNSTTTPAGSTYWYCECSMPNYETSTTAPIVLSPAVRDYAHGICFNFTFCNITYPEITGLQSHSKDDPAEEVPTKYPLNGTSPTNLNASSLQITPMIQSGSAFFTLIGLNETLENILGRSELTGNTKMPPIVIVTSPLCGGYYYKLNVPLQFTINQPVSLINYTLDVGLTTLITGNTNLTGLSDGVHTVTVYADGGTSATMTFGYCLGDVDKSGMVDVLDASTIGIKLGCKCVQPCWDTTAYDVDINDDCEINTTDLDIISANFGTSCPAPIPGVTCPQPPPWPIFIYGTPSQVVPGDPHNREYRELVGVSGGGKIGDIFNVTTDYQVVISLYNITANASNIAEFVKSPLVNLSLDAGASLYISSDYDHGIDSNTTIELAGTVWAGGLQSFFSGDPFQKPYTAGTKILLPAPNYKDLYVVKFNNATPGETISIWAGSREASRTPIPLLNVSELDVTSKEVIAQVLPDPRELEITSNVSGFSGRIEGTNGDTTPRSTNFATAGNSVTTGADLYTNILKISITGSSPYQNFEIKTTPLSNQPNDPVGIIKILPKEFAETMYINKTGTYLFGSMDRFMLDIPDNLSLGFHNFSYMFIDRFNNTFTVPYSIYLRLPTALVSDVVAERDADDANLTNVSFKGVLLYTRLDEPTLQPSHPVAYENVSIYINNITEEYAIDSKPPAPPYHQYGFLMNLTTNATGEFNGSFDIRGWGRFYIISLFNGTNVLAPSLSIKPFYGGGIAVVFGNPQTLIPLMLVFLSIFLRKSLRRAK